jgi:hypothetical protein
MIPKTVERTQLTDPLLYPIPVITNCVSAVLALVMRSGRGGHYRLWQLDHSVVSSLPFNTQECRASPLHKTANRLGEAAAKKEKHFEFSSV